MNYGEHMRKLDLSSAPQGFIVWRYPQDNFDSPYELDIPLGIEAVVVRDGEITGPYRTGDHERAARTLERLRVLCYDVAKLKKDCFYR